VLSRSYCGKLSVGYPITYSITDKINVFNDLAGVLNRLDLNNSRGLVIEGAHSGVFKGFRKLFNSANFNFDELFGIKFGVETDRKNAPNPLSLIDSRDYLHHYSFHHFVHGYTSVGDLFRGYCLDDASIVSDVELTDYLPDGVSQEIIKLFPGHSIIEKIADYLKIRFGVSSQFDNESIKVKIGSGRFQDLTDYECVQLLLKLIGSDLFFTKTELVDRVTNLRYNCLFVGKGAWLCAASTLVMVDLKRCFPFDSSSQTRIDLLFSRKDRDKRCRVGLISDMNYVKALRNNYHITWYRPAKFRDLV